ncbi:hypothetical protein PanWU01x14_074540 [Parasponia andersonii]|uniref:Transmembrane protein n=1 Tax=Parasponia andersonii TaxID=3476 RepID=A0A2P5DDE4_PARAD|nr:hypothetical protein PanWU01x14_074540 [Parasponia andersonii]
MLQFPGNCAHLISSPNTNLTVFVTTFSSLTGFLETLPLTGFLASSTIVFVITSLSLTELALSSKTILTSALSSTFLPFFFFTFSCTTLRNREELGSSTLVKPISFSSTTIPFSLITFFIPSKISNALRLLGSILNTVLTSLSAKSNRFRAS